MPDALSRNTIQLVKLSVPALVAHGTEITRNMYQRLFQDDHIRELFNHSNQGEGGAQVHALAKAILAYASNIDNLEALVPMVERIAYKHIGYHILPEHYPYVARALLAAIEDVLGDAATDDVMAAWGEAYWFLAEILKGREQQIRTELEVRTGGWTGWRSFFVAERIKESNVVTSFILKPEDGRPVARHLPGQYLTVRLRLPSGYAIKRNYSISSGPNDEYYRISVKRESNGQGGSIYLHDHAHVGTRIEVTPPTGDFYLENEAAEPVVLLSGGVGLTPMVSMLEAIVSERRAVDVHFLHGALNSSTHAMDAHVRSIAQEHGRTTVRTFYSEPDIRDAKGYSHDFDGFITIDWLRANTPFDTARFYLCGPKPFLRSMVSGLTREGVTESRINYEFFGPTDEKLEAA
ncbi:NO-inducible flavohemoprotein [Agrobacterium sp. B1(2019)]|uniref:NO-inducible flavohemoprotein n=1 Tax=Agrobacterium sp. B1(2019) TaxID=2607032 RepID=UPI0011EFD546|nr:NO-inducible flavohemoprotein [Agrobacterium sp. B1(2019)]TZG36511.1 NO-inducible flavohemoprotein [Agrobacterium sp. B1(2019)]